LKASSTEDQPFSKAAASVGVQRPTAAPPGLTALGRVVVVVGLGTVVVVVVLGRAAVVVGLGTNF
jgi:hypothetical protein